MPWEDIMAGLGRCVDDQEMETPLPPDVLVHVVRLHMKIGNEEWCTHLKQVKLRAHVCLGLAQVLIDHKHPAFRNGATPVVLKARFARLLAERYPDPEGDKLPGEMRDGKVPDPILAAASESMQ